MSPMPVGGPCLPGEGTSPVLVPSPFPRTGNGQRPGASARGSSPVALPLVARPVRRLNVARVERGAAEADGDDLVQLVAHRVTGGQRVVDGLAAQRARQPERGHPATELVPPRPVRPPRVRLAHYRPSIGLPWLAKHAATPPYASTRTMDPTRGRYRGTGTPQARSMARLIAVSRRSAARIMYSTGTMSPPPGIEKAAPEDGCGCKTSRYTISGSECRKRQLSALLRCSCSNGTSMGSRSRTPDAHRSRAPSTL